MFSFINTIRVTLFSTLLLVSGISLAAGQGYIGGGVGASSTDAAGFEDGTSFQIFGGYMFNPNFGLEGGFTNLGDFDLTGAPGSNVSVDGFYGAAVLGAPVGKGGFIKGKLGFYSWNFDGVGPGIAADTDGTDLMYGVGFDWYFNQSVGVGIEYDVYSSVNDEDVDAFWLNLLIKFAAK